MTRFLPVFVVAMVIAPVPARAQSPLMYNWGPNQGLVQYSVSSIAQDAHGYIWLGAESGASRFNGRDFETYDDCNGFVNEAVRDVVVSGSEVFLLTEAGELYEVVSGGARKIETGVRIVAVLDAPEGGRPWLLTETGLRRGFDADDEPLPFAEVGEPLLSTRVDNEVFIAIGQTIYRLDHEIEIVAELPFLVEDLFEGPDHQLGVVSRSRLVFVDPKTGDRVVRWETDDLNLRCGFSAHGRTVVGTTGGALVLIEDDDVEILEHGLPRQAVMTLLIDRENNIWAGLDSGGLLLLPLAAFTSYTRADGVGTGDAFYIVADRLRGGVWVGTRNGGIAHIHDDGVRSVDSSSGMPSDRTRAIFQSSDGTVFAGIANGIFVIEPSGKTWIHRAAEESFFQFFYETEQGIVFSGSRDGRFVAWNGGRKFRAVDLDLIPNDLGFTSMVAHRGRYFLGTTRGVYDFKLASVSSNLVAGVDVTGPHCEPARVRDMIVDDNHQLWVGTNANGAWRLGDDGWTHFGITEGFDQQVRFIVRGPKGHPWFGGNRGVWSYPDVEASRLNTSRGLRSDNVFLVRFDPQGQLWVGHNVGLDVIRDGRVVARFDNRDGLADNELNANGFTVDEKGRLWFCTMRGVSRIDSAAMARGGVNPLIHLRKIEANDQTFSKQENGGGLALRKLDHDQNSVRFHFSGQSFVDPEAVRYTYKLDGIDDDWCRPVAVGWAYYPKLPPGRYLFQVRCFSSDDLESPIAEIVVEIIPALWQRMSFRFCVAALVLGTIFGALVLRNRRIAELNIELERLVGERTRDLASANEELRRLSITDPLTGLFNRRFFEEEIQSELAVALRSFRNARTGQAAALDNAYLAMFMLDLDHFKKINDEFGHDAGDMVLRDFARVVRDVIRSSDTLFRWGGEEFLLLARNTDPSSTEILAERIRVSVREHLCRFEGKEIRVTCSLGFVPFPFNAGTPGGLEWAELIHLADQALYLAKAQGRDAWVGVSATKLLENTGRVPEVLRDLVAARDQGLIELDSNRSS